MALCGDAGCSDPGTGDYDVVVPADQALGVYKLEVVSAADPSVKRCSDAAFSVVEEGDAAGDSSTEAAATPAPSPPPLPTFAPAAPTGQPRFFPSPLRPPAAVSTTPLVVAVHCAARKQQFTPRLSPLRLPHPSTPVVTMTATAVAVAAPVPPGA